MVIASVAPVVAFVSYTRVETQEAQRAELFCDGLKAQIMSLAEVTFRFGFDFGAADDTPENWKGYEANYYPGQLSVGSKLYDSPQPVKDVVEAMIPYARVLFFANRDDARWQIGRELCINMEKRRWLDND